MKKTKHAKNAPLPTTSAARLAEPDRADVAVCAYAIWEQEGRPQGRDVQHWLEAEFLLRHGRGRSTPPE